MIIFQLYMLVCTLFLAGKDATSFKLKDKTDNSLTLKRIKRWHRDGVALNALFVVPFVLFSPASWWEYVLAALIIRLSVFDLAFNYWAGLSITYLGSTAIFDRVFSSIFGTYGALKKSMAFAILLLLLDFTLLK